jgi:hypothetical protein
LIANKLETLGRLGEKRGGSTEYGIDVVNHLVAGDPRQQHSKEPCRQRNASDWRASTHLSSEALNELNERSEASRGQKYVYKEVPIRLFTKHLIYHVETQGEKKKKKEEEKKNSQSSIELVDHRIHHVDTTSLA